MSKLKTQTTRTIHQIIGPNITPLIRRCIESWKQLIPLGFEIKMWNDEDIGEFILKTYPFAYDPFINARNHAEAADIARYLIVYTYGGYYADWDVELINPERFMSLHHKHPNGYMLIDPINSTLASEYFCAAPLDEYLINLSNDIAGFYRRGLRDFLGTPQYSGPFRMRDSLTKHPKTHMEIVPVKEVFAFDYSEIRGQTNRNIDAPLIHYWVHSWIK